VCEIFVRDFRYKSNTPGRCIWDPPRRIQRASHNLRGGGACVLHAQGSKIAGLPCSGSEKMCVQSCVQISVQICVRISVQIFVQISVRSVPPELAGVR
jgi:hypothetical protein